jgi:hypothetical protein
MLADGVVHRIWSEIKFSWPGYSTVLDRHPDKKKRVTQCGENSGFWRVQEPGHVNHSSQAVCKSDLQPKL